MALGVGINENVVLDGAQLNDKKVLMLSFREKSEISLFDQMSASELVEGNDKLVMRVWPFKVPDKKDMSNRQKSDRVIEDIRSTKNIMIHFLCNFYTKEEVKLDTYGGTGITRELSQQAMLDKHISQQVLDKIWLNLTKDFLRLAKPLVGNDEIPFRLKLKRQSKDKHFPAFPDKFLESRPFIEPMTVPVEASAVKFDKWEIDNKLNDGTPSHVSNADKVPDMDGDGLDNTFSEDEMFTPPAAGADDLDM